MTCTSKTTDFYEIATGRKLRSIPYPSWNVAISPDCRMIALDLKDGGVQVVDLESAKERLRLPGANMWGLSFASDGKSLISASAKSRTSCRWDLATGKQLKADLELSPNKAALLAAHQRHVKVAEDFARFADKALRNGASSKSDGQLARYRLIDAKIDLEREKARK